MKSLVFAVLCAASMSVSAHDAFTQESGQIPVEATVFPCNNNASTVTGNTCFCISSTHACWTADFTFYGWGDAAQFADQPADACETGNPRCPQVYVTPDLLNYRPE